MTLPNYIVNLDELADLILEAMKDRTLEYKGLMGSRGFRINKDLKYEKWVLNEEKILTGFKIAYTDTRNMGEYDNTLTMTLNGKPVLENIAIAEYENYIRFSEFIKTNEGDVIEFYVYGNKIDVDIVFNLEYIFYGDLFEPVRVIIKCVDINLPKDHEHWLIKTTTTFIRPPTRTQVCAPEVSGYYIVGDRCKTVTVDFGDKDIEVIFYFTPAPKKVVVSHKSTTGEILETEIEMVDPPRTIHFFAKEFEGYYLVSSPRLVLEVFNWSNGTLYVEFLYRPITKKIKILCIEKDTGFVLQTIRDKVYKYPTTYKAEAPTIKGYVVIGAPSQEIYIELDSPSEIEIIFYYDTEEIIIDHEYDYKAVLRWSGNSPIDVDLTMFLRGGDMDYDEKIYFGKRTYEERVDPEDEKSELIGKAWLDYDYLTHGGEDDYIKKPEIGTILGFRNLGRFWDVEVKHFTSSQQLVGDIDISIYGIDMRTGQDILILKESLDVDRLFYSKKRICKVCSVELDSGEVETIMEYY